jgi:5-methylcytosine-specific restriction endonuclease McrBC regulatory subunit McrC
MAVLDTKYKRNHSPEESDIQQIVAYAVRMNTKNAFLIYPSTTTKSVALHVGDVCVMGVCRSQVVQNPVSSKCKHTTL